MPKTKRPADAKAAAAMKSGWSRTAAALKDKDKNRAALDAFNAKRKANAQAAVDRTAAAVAAPAVAATVAAQTSRTPGLSPKLRPQLLAPLSKPKPGQTFRTFVESNGIPWDGISKHPRYADLKALWDGDAPKEPAKAAAPATSSAPAKGKRGGAQGRSAADLSAAARKAWETRRAKAAEKEPAPAPAAAPAKVAPAPAPKAAPAKGKAARAAGPIARKARR